MTANIKLEIELDNDMVQEIMEDEGYEKFNEDEVKSVLNKIDMAELLDDFSDLVTQTIEVAAWSGVKSVERLTKRDKDGNIYYDGALDPIKCLAELEDKIESGEMLIPPCKVGDTVYYPDEVDDGNSIFFKIRKGIVDCFNIEVGCKEALVKYDGGLTYWHNFASFGETVFTDKTQAEVKLKELQNK